MPTRRLGEWALVVTSFLPSGVLGDGCSRHADGFIDDVVEKLVVVGAGLFLDVLSGAAACSRIVRQGKVSVVGGDFGEFANDGEEVLLVLATEDPGLVDSGDRKSTRLNSSHLGIS